MTIGRNSRKSSVRSSIRAPKFLDKSTGFYGRLEDAEVVGGVEQLGETEAGERLDGVESESFDVEAARKAEGMMGDDGETLLQRKPSRLSSRWRRSTHRKPKEGRVEEDQPPDALSAELNLVVLEVVGAAEDGPLADPKESPLVHFATREDADDQVLIRDTEPREEEEGEEERRMKKEQEEGMKMLKRNAVKNYRKTLDRAFRRGWEALVTNLYSVTLTPVKPTSLRTSSLSTKKQKQQRQQHNSVLAEFQ